MKRFRKLLCLLTVLVMVMSMGVGVCAEETDEAETTESTETESSGGAATNPADAVVEIVLGYKLDNGEIYGIQYGSGFLISDECIITNYHVAFPSSDSLEAVKKELGLEKLNANDSHLQLYVMTVRDQKRKVSIASEDSYSQEMDYACLKLEEPLPDRKYLSLGDSDQIEQADEVSALGFPEDSVQTDRSYTPEDVTYEYGRVSKVTTNAGYKIFEHSAKLNDGNSGGPLIDVETNSVIGINSFKSATKFYAIQINEIKYMLTSAGIAYTEAGEVIDTEIVDSDDDDTVDKTSLDNAIRDAEGRDSELYTEESFAEMEAALATAKGISAKEDAAQDEIDSASSSLQGALNNLEEEPETNIMPFILIGVAVVVVIIIIILIVVLSKGKKKKKAEPVNNNYSSIPTNGPASAASANVSQAPQSNGGFVHQAPVDEGVGETTVLDSGAGETTVLGGGINAAYLIRKKNHEKIVLNSANFMIGKERSKVNYCISDNTSVSRCHAQILRKGADYYICDKNSTNYTYVDGSKIAPHQETKLENNTNIKFADEEFTFYLS